MIWLFLILFVENVKAESDGMGRTGILVISFISLILFLLGVMACFVYYSNWKKKREDPQPRYCPITHTKVIPTKVEVPRIVKGKFLVFFYQIIQTSVQN